MSDIEPGDMPPEEELFVNPDVGREKAETPSEPAEEVGAPEGEAETPKGEPDAAPPPSEESEDTPAPKKASELAKKRRYKPEGKRLEALRANAKKAQTASKTARERNREMIAEALGEDWEHHCLYTDALKYVRGETDKLPPRKRKFYPKKCARSPEPEPEPAKPAEPERAEPERAPAKPDPTRSAKILETRRKTREAITKLVGEGWEDRITYSQGKALLETGKLPEISRASPPQAKEPASRRAVRRQKSTALW
jgi:DNA polymerase III gamma/tau subunit